MFILSKEKVLDAGPGHQNRSKWKKHRWQQGLSSGHSPGRQAGILLNTFVHGAYFVDVDPESEGGEVKMTQVASWNWVLVLCSALLPTQQLSSYLFCRKSALVLRNWMP